MAWSTGKEFSEDTFADKVAVGAKAFTPHAQLNMIEEQGTIALGVYCERRGLSPYFVHGAFVSHIRAQQLEPQVPE